MWFFQVVKIGLCEKEALFRRENVKTDNIWTEKEDLFLLLFKILLFNTALSVILYLSSSNMPKKVVEIQPYHKDWVF